MTTRTCRSPTSTPSSTLPLTHATAKKVMTFTALMVSTASHLLAGLHHHGRDGLWEVACSPHSWLSMAGEKHGIPSRRINLTNGYDLYNPATWQQLRELRRQRRPRRMWFSLPCTKSCSWTSVNYNTPEKKVKLETERRRERRMLWHFNDFVKESMEEDEHILIYFEWTHPCSGWRQQPMADLEAYFEKHDPPWLGCRVDGCRYGMKNVAGDAFVLKKWLIKTNDEMFHHEYRAKTCPGGHGQHASIQGVETARSAYYPWQFVESIARHWQRRVAPPRHLRLLQLREDSPALRDSDELYLEMISCWRSTYIKHYLSSNDNGQKS